MGRLLSLILYFFFLIVIISQVWTITDSLFLTFAGCNYDCHICGKRYSSQGALYNHVKFVCGKDPQFTCPFCSYKAKLKGNLKKHIINMHPLEFASNKCNPPASVQ